MKYPIQILSVMVVFLLASSCSKELFTVRKAKKYQQQLRQLSQKLFLRFDKETFISPRQFDSLQLSKSDKKLLLDRVKCPYIQIIYNDRHSRFIQTDSVVLFTRTGFPIIGSEHDIMLDMRKNIRDSIPADRNFIRYYKIGNGIYYIKDYMPEF